jgi:excisionase family DNA binding protein
MSHKAIPDASDEYCGTSYAAKLLNLSVGTVQTLVEKNELTAWKTQGGHRRISIQSIRDYQNRAQSFAERQLPRHQTLESDGR